MRHKSVGINVIADDTLLTIPNDKKAIIASIYVSNKDITSATIDIKVIKGVDNFYLIKAGSNGIIFTLY